MNARFFQRNRNFIMTVAYPLALGTLLLVLTVYIFMTLKYKSTDDNRCSQTQPFDVTVGNKEYNQVSLADLSFDPVKKGTVITYSTELRGYITSPMLRILSAHSITNVALDGETIYHYGDESWHMQGYGYLNIPLPDNYAGRTLKVTMKVCESEEVRSLRTPVIYNTHEFYYSFINSKRLLLMVDLAMMVLSFAIVVMSIIFMRSMPDAKNLIWLAAAFCTSALWELCSSNMLFIFVHNRLAEKSYLEYISFYFTPFLFYMYFFDDFNSRKKTLTRVLYNHILILQFIFPVVSIFLHFADIVHLPRMLHISHIMLAVTLLFILVAAFRQLFRKDAEHRGLMIGTIIIVVVCIVDVINYVIVRYVTYVNTDYNSIILLGLFMFALCMIYDFFSTRQANIKTNAKNDVLEQIAYIDMMTGLKNRRKCDDTLSEIAEARGKHPFAIINFDLNDLKKTNDLYGHLAGDELLTDFSNLLAASFPDSAVVGRMGGDEFIAILPDTTSLSVDDMLTDLSRKTAEANITRKPIPISYAYGVATGDAASLPDVTSDDADTRLRAVLNIYKKSDAAMYEHKAAMKAARA